MNNLKKLKYKLTAVLVIVFIIASCIVAFELKNLSKNTFQDSPISTYSVVIDAGHGGIDGGALGSRGVYEREINLQISLKLKEVFESRGYKVTLTRTDNNGLYDDTSPGFKLRDLKKRVEIIKNAKPSIFISVHLNTYTSPSRRGAQVFYKKGSENSKKLADSVQLELNLLKESKRMYDALAGDYYLLNSLDIPSIIVECGFLSNPEEENLLLSEEYQNTLAKAIYNGSIRYFTNL
jgi:N-acetylmuramoyl-L-alanine amidase